MDDLMWKSASGLQLDASAVTSTVSPFSSSSRQSLTGSRDDSGPRPVSNNPHPQLHRARLASGPAVAPRQASHRYHRRRSKKDAICLQEQAPTARRHNAVARHQSRPALVEQDTVEMSILNVKPSVTGSF